MCRPAFAPACVLVLVLASESRAEFQVLAPADAATRVSTDFSSASPTYSLSAVLLAASMDTHYGGSFTDIGLKYNLGAAVPAGATVTSATLAITVANAFAIRTPLDSASLDVAGFTAASGPLTLADFYAPNPMANVGEASIALASGIASSYPIVLQFDVTSLVESLLGAGGPAVLFQLTAGADTNITLAGAGGLGSAGASSLAITFAAAVPEPASAWLATLGVALIAGLGRLARRHRAA